MKRWMRRSRWVQTGFHNEEGVVILLLLPFRVDLSLFSEEAAKFSGGDFRDAFDDLEGIWPLVFIKISPCLRVLIKGESSKSGKVSDDRFHFA